MQKIISSVLVVWGLATCSWVFAGPKLSVDIDGNCSVVDGLGNDVTTQTGNVLVDSQGNGRLKCDPAAVTPSLDGGAVEWNFENTGLVCNNLGFGDFQTTTRWKSQLDASGKSRLICHFPDEPGNP